MNRIKILIIVVAFGVEFVYIALAAMANRSEAANNALLHFTGFGMKIVLFPKSWW